VEEQHASTSLTRPDAETLLKVAFLHELLILLISSNIMIGGGGGFLECEYQGSKTNCAEKGGGGMGRRTGKRERTAPPVVSPRPALHTGLQQLCKYP